MKTGNDDFDLLNSFAHDLKTPLSAVKSYVELIEHAGELNEQQLYFSNRAQNGLARIQQIIEELLDFARMESDLTLHMETVDLQQIAMTTVDLLEALAEEKSVSIYVEIPEKVQYIHADERMIRHVISNLLSNAIKYNRRGGELHLQATDVRDAVRVQVRDTGIGIPPEALPRIFEKFYRVERRKGHQKIEGTGLGLAIVKTVIERHGGTITVDSRVDEGTTFTFTLARAFGSPEDLGREASDDTDDRMQEKREIIEDSDSRDDYINE